MPKCAICGYQSRKKIMRRYFTKVGKKHYCSRCYTEHGPEIRAKSKKRRVRR